MREVVGTAMNVALVECGKDRRLQAMVECVLVVNEPTYTVECGELQRHREPETIRFAACPEALRNMADTFRAWATEAESVQERHGAGASAGSGQQTEG